MKATTPSPEEVIATARRLLSVGNTLDAQNLLLEEGYVKRLEPTIQSAYLQLVPVGPTLRQMLDEVYEGLDDANPKIRFHAATKLAREFSKELLRDNVRWMSDPRASEPLMNAVLSDDRKLSDRALIALMRLVCKYFPDQRALPAFVAKLSDRKQDTRNNAISGIGCLRCEDALENLLPMIKQGSDQDRAQVARQIAGLAYETLHNTSQNPIAWTTEGRRFWRDTMMEALQDSASEVRQQAAFALENFGDSDTLPALGAARRGETDDNAAYYIDRAIAVLKDS